MKKEGSYGKSIFYLQLFGGKKSGANPRNTAFVRRNHEILKQFKINKTQTFYKKIKNKQLV